MMNKKIISLIAVLIASSCFTQAKEKRIISGTVLFFQNAQAFCNGVAYDPCNSLTPCLDACIATKAVLIAPPKIISGSGFKVSDGRAVILPNPFNCPNAQEQAACVFSFDVTFCKPFKKRPSITNSFEISGTSFSIPFPLGSPSPTFAVTLTGSFFANTNVTCKGFTSEFVVTYQACPIGENPAPTNVEVCNAILCIGELIINSTNPEFNFAISFQAIGI